MFFNCLGQHIIFYLPVYSRWNPAAETLMSDWKFRYRLLDVLFKRWGLVVPEMIIEKAVQWSYNKYYNKSKLTINQPTNYHLNYVLLKCFVRIFK